MTEYNFRPSSYHLNNGCHNCKFMLDNSDWDYQEFFCEYIVGGRPEKIEPLPLDKESTEEGLEYLRDMYAKEGARKVELYGHCDKWELEENKYDKHQI